MSYEPLHHKYRPQTFMDLVGQEAIAQTLINAITTNRIAPAYLFTGPRGTGKTSSARILAKSLNCLSSEKPTPIPCGSCEVCKAIARSSALDVIEIDAASNTGVDNIREIIERAQFAPVQCRYKVYVIDECHMLSVAAFNALLKTLEEPPNHVVFVLATTDPQRVLPTIISRCQRFDYRRIPLEEMVKHLKLIASKESINIDDPAITLVAQIANGGLRDAESLLDQLSLLSGTVTPDRVWELVGAIPEIDLLNLLQAIKSKNPSTILDRCRHLMNRGKEPLTVLQNLAGFYLNLVIAKTAPSRSDLVAVTSETWTQLCQEAQQWNLVEILQGQQHLKESEAQLKNTTQPRLWLEVTLLGLLSLGVSNKPSIEQPPVKGKVDPSPPPPKPTPEVTPPPTKPEPVQELPTPTTEEPITPAQNSQPRENLDQLWRRIIQQVQPPATQALFSQHGILISFDDSVAVIGVNSQNLFKLYQARISSLETAFKSIFQKYIKINIQINNVNQSSERPKENPPLNQNYTRQIEPIEEVYPPLSTPKSDEQPTVTNNGKSPHLDPPSISEPDSQLPSVESNGNGAIQEASPPLDVSPISVNEIKPESEEDINKALEVLIKAFEGELINSDDIIKPDFQKIEEKIPNSITPQIEPAKLTDTYLEKGMNQQQSEPENIPQIKGRPDLSNLSEDELDF